MRLIAQIMLVIFTLVTASGHGSAQPVVYHAHEHHQSDANLIDGHHHKAHVIVQTHAQAEYTVDVCAHHSCELPENDQSGAHFHVPCCGSLMALLPTEFGAKVLTVAGIDQQIGRSSVTLGQLQYPLLRPPRLLV